MSELKCTTGGKKDKKKSSALVLWLWRQSNIFPSHAQLSEPPWFQTFQNGEETKLWTDMTATQTDPSESLSKAEKTCGHDLNETSVWEKHCYILWTRRTTFSLKAWRVLVSHQNWNMPGISNCHILKELYVYRVRYSEKCFIMNAFHYFQHKFSSNSALPVWLNLWFVVLFCFTLLLFCSNNLFFLCTTMRGWYFHLV